MEEEEAPTSRGAAQWLTVYMIACGMEGRGEERVGMRRERKGTEMREERKGGRWNGKGIEKGEKNMREEGIGMREEGKGIE